MDNDKLQDVRCTICGSLVCKKYAWADMRGIVLWCRKCKKNLEFNSISAPEADDK